MFFRVVSSYFKAGNEPQVHSPTSEEGFSSIKSAISNHYHILEEIAAEFKCNSPPSTAAVHSNPIILCLGNHSSGKSSFINFLLGQEIQKSSAAPLDDSFTLFTYGKPYSKHQNFVEQSGEGLALNKNLPFHSLSNVQGGKFLHRVKLKYVEEKKLEEIMLVDSPGMIDATQSRDYDFSSAIQWFSERADLILFFFDPEKPGTSAESLAIFSQLLNKADHKLVVVLNKVDSFESVNDFARTYGTLCWNLAKVISFKDMPMIYTTHLPTHSGLPKFENALSDLQNKIIAAPARHVDTLITDFEKYTGRLLMHCRVASHIRSHVATTWWKTSLWILFFTIMLIFLSLYATGGEFSAYSLLSCFIGFSLLCSVPSFLTRKEEQRALEQIETHFCAEYFSELRENRQSVLKTWEAVKSELEGSLKQWGVFSIPQFGKARKAKLCDLLTLEVQRLLDTLQTSVST